MRGFHQSSLWFSVFFNNDGEFLNFSVQFTVFDPDFAKEVTHCGRAKTVILRVHLSSVLRFLLEE